MKTKAILASLVIERLTGGKQDAASQYDMRMVLEFVDSCLGEAIEIALKKNDWKMRDDLLSRFLVKIQWDEMEQKAFFNLPAKLVSLPKGMGLHEIAPKLDNKLPHVMQDNGSQSYYAHLECADVGENLFTCFLDGARVVYNNMKKGEVCDVIVRMISAIDGYAEDEPIKLPGETEGYLMDVVYRKYIDPKKFLVKMVNNSNPNSDV